MRIIGEALQSLIMACSIGGLPADLLEAIALTESNGYAYAVSGSYTSSNYFLLPRSEAEVSYAIDVAAESVQRDINVSVGLMQLNSWHIKRMGANVPLAMDPCNNILLATSVLKEITNRVCKTKFDDSCLSAALRQYNTGSLNASNAGDEYVRRVSEKMRAVNPSNQFAGK